MPILEVSLLQEFKQQRTVNRWTYLASGTPAAVSLPFGLASALGAIESAGVYPTGGMLWKIALIQSAQVTFNELVVRDVYDPEEFYTVPFIVELTGQVTGDESMPAFNAYGFRTNRTRLDVRRATKRFVGVTEGNQSGGDVDSTFLAGAITDVATAMSAVLQYDDEGNTLSYSPIVCSKEKYAVPGSDPTRYAYRYYSTVSEQLDHIMEGIAWEPYSTIRSQTSRQLGRGQ